ncbi:hypothetical protein [Streptomyces sp. CdTB01]|uniref:hypothetical protein n=1 Tax=Streptomyces sp. CdTB01 TaxID=1725411 RepID=UPI00073AE262|nr:hypothetical protein [Streptomyces sp. CdTB01]ALV37944.1 hypothetical protein AS200_42260 [Streptomyces sp. CdTB01]
MAVHLRLGRRRGRVHGQPQYPVPGRAFMGEPAVRRQVLVPGRHDRDDSGYVLGLGQPVAEPAEQHRQSTAQPLPGSVQAAQQHALGDQPARVLLPLRAERGHRRRQQEVFVGVLGVGGAGQMGPAAGELVQVAPGGMAYGPVGGVPRE